MVRPFQRQVNALNAVFSYIMSTLNRKPVVYGFPPSVGIELTNHCNLHCPECSTGSGMMTRKKGYMDLMLFDKILSEMNPYLYYATLYFQGESMMHPGFFSFLRLSEGINTIVSTNGHFLSAENVEKLVKSGLDRLIVSLDGMDQEIYASYRVGGELVNVLDGIRNVSNANRKAGSPLNLEIQYLVSRKNEQQVHLAKQFAAEVNASFKLKTMQIINPNDYNEWIPADKRFSRYKEENGHFVIKNSFPNHCARLWLNPVITWDGKVLPCCFDKDADYIMGDLNEETFREIWNGPRYNIFRKSLLSGRYMTDICRNCTSGLRGVKH